MGEMKEIQIDGDVFARLQEKAQPLVDTPNDVLRRLLIDQPVKPRAKKAAKTRARKAAKAPAAAKKPTRRKVLDRAPRGSLVQESEYVQPILQALVAAGGSGKAGDVMAAVGRRMQHMFKPAEYAKTAAGVTRWESRARDVRNRLVKDGLIAPASASKFGVWEITPQGRNRAAGI